MTADNYCADLVLRHDPDRFLLSVFAPAACRPALWALYAFNHEIAKTREVVTETQLGLIRLQWWRDAIAAIYEGGKVPEHKILQPLAQAIRKYDLSRDLFDALVYAREFDLEDRLPSTREGMAKYAEFTNMPLLQLALKIEDKVADENKIRDAATAYGLVGLLRAVPAHLRQRRCYLPEDLLGAEGISVYDLYDGSAVDKLKPVVFQMAEEAERHMVRAPATKRQVRLAWIYLDRIRSADFDVFSKRLHQPLRLLPLRLLFS